MSLPQTDATSDPQNIVAVLQQRLDAALSEKAALAEALALRNSEFGERIEHQAATLDVLKAMSASPGDPQPVFDLIVRHATELCNVPRRQRCSNMTVTWSTFGSYYRDRDVRGCHSIGGIRATVSHAPDARVYSLPGDPGSADRPHPRSETGLRAGTASAVSSGTDRSVDPADARRPAIGAISIGSPGTRRLLRQSDCAAANLRRAGGDRDHQRGDVSRVADPHERSSGIAGIPDRDQRRAEGHQPIDLRSATGAGYGRRDGGAALRG